MFSPCEVKAKAGLLIFGQLWDKKTKSGPNVNTCKCLIFRKIGLSPYLCVLISQRFEQTPLPDKLQSV